MFKLLEAKTQDDLIREIVRVCICEPMKEMIVKLVDEEHYKYWCELGRS